VPAIIQDAQHKNVLIARLHESRRLLMKTIEPIRLPYLIIATKNRFMDKGWKRVGKFFESVGIKTTV